MMTDAVEQAAVTPAAEAAPEAPVEKPFTLDLLQSCTARMTHQCWRTYSAIKTDLTALQTVPLRASLLARTAKGLADIKALLADAGVATMTPQDDKTVTFNATFAQIQTVIKHPQTHTVDAVRVA
jgi:hypothetical protein